MTLRHEQSEVQPVIPTITLWEPWGTLLLEGFKTDETRSWAPPGHLVGGRMAIHTAARRANLIDVEEYLHELGRHDRYSPAGKRYGDHQHDTTHGGRADWSRFVRQHLPRGKVIAIATLAWVLPTTHGRVSPDRYGDFSPGRFAWHFTDLVRIEPVAAKGKQGIWYWPVPDNLKELGDDDSQQDRDGESEGRC